MLKKILLGIQIGLMLLSASSAFSASFFRIPRTPERLNAEFGLPIVQESLNPVIQSSDGHFNFWDFGSHIVLTPIWDSSLKFSFGQSTSFDATLGQNHSLTEAAFLSLQLKIRQLKSAIPFHGPKLAALSILNTQNGRLLGIKIEKISGRLLTDLNLQKIGPGNSEDASLYFSFIQDAANRGTIPLDAHSFHFYEKNKLLRPMGAVFFYPTQLANRRTDSALATHEGEMLSKTILTITRAEVIFKGNEEPEKASACKNLISQIQSLYRRNSTSSFRLVQ
jgi:hypothetical protein